MDKPYILCVDDEITILRELKNQIKNFRIDNICVGESYQIEILESGHEAVSFFKELYTQNKSVALVVCDYIMPDMKGDEVLRHIHQLSPETYTFLLTGQATIEGIENAVNNANVYKYIPKPWDKEVLYSHVKEVHELIAKSKNIYKLKFRSSDLELKIRTKVDEIDKIKNENRLLETSEAELHYETVKSIGESLDYVRKSFEMLQFLKESIKENLNAGNEKLETCITSFDVYFSNASKSISQLISSVEEHTTKNNIYDPFSSSIFNEMYNETSKMKNEISSSIHELTYKISDLEKKFKKEPKRIISWDNEKILIFNIDEVLYFASEGRNIGVTTKKGTYRVRETMSELEKELAEYNFFRCHKSYLVNLKYVNKIEPWINYDSYISTLEGCDTEIPVSRNYIKEMKQTLGI